MRFLKKIFSRFFSKEKKYYLFIEEVADFYEDYDYESDLFFYDENGEAHGITLICTCQSQVIILSVDRDYDPPLPHFDCTHCDRPCSLKGCAECLVYNSMLEARLIMEERPKD